MKKLLLISCLLLLCSCESKEQIEKKNEEKKYNEMVSEVQKSDSPESTKEWLIDVNQGKVLTILCITTSGKCTKIKENVSKIKGAKVYYLNVDELNDQEKDTYKNKFTLNDYTGYLPYLMLSNDNKLLKTKTDIYEVNDINKFITE